MSSLVVNNKLVKHAVQIHKFGGSSLASIECVNRVVEIIQHNCQLHDIVVVSANGDITDDLIEIYQFALQNSEQLHQSIEQLKQKQRDLVFGLLNESNAEALFAELLCDFELLAKWLQIDISEHEAELLAFGECWSARLLAAILAERVCPSFAIDSREFLVINNDVDCQVDYDVSQNHLSQLLDVQKLAVITGYIAKNTLGLPCTLGRNGSDYSATIIAALTNAQNVTLWTDVDGIYSADPRVVPLSRKLHRVPRSVAKELGRLGNPVLHAKTLQPLERVGSHLHVASSFDPDMPGTEVGDFGQIAKQELSVTYANDLLLVQSESFVGESGQLAFHKFSAISGDLDDGQLVIHLSQQKAVSEWLASDDTEVKFTPVSVMAIVGHNVARRGNVKARFKRALKHHQPIAFFNQLHSDSLVSVLPQPCTGELLNNVHHDVTKDARHIGIVVAGLGNIGQCFIELLPQQLSRVSALENVHLVGLVSSKKILFQSDGIEAECATQAFEEHAVDYSEEALLEWLSNHPYDELIVVDITPSESFSQLYSQFFANGIHVIGANKWAASAPLNEYQRNLTLAEKHQVLWLGNTTVGAGLPINHALEDLQQSGDNIVEISGIFSGTLSWLFEKYDGSSPFSELMSQALSDGITEPDPREDLSGRDVQRKLLILARLAGFELSLEDIACENLVPESLAALPLNEFLSRAEELNAPFKERLAAAKKMSSCIRYVARFKTEGGEVQAKVSLETLPQSDAFAALTPCDNVFKVVSNWYQENALIIRGPGAGREVTAGGLHSDLVNACRQLANKQHQVKLKGIN
ncbi:bifunctional aspartate kinase/homoserine dehydrogenase II [Thalassotalea sp. M1531]|uniref:Bifunctional aspartokinase/homoserine dehydrogenase n=1 Tax=Thalassotalea algicola TaxID=2716224 RepID=A0A7Y0L9L7_9GAMM|nr:bifunctional aspartate kinase/homoserine dehydrogenase II [Thalassotalea algicola]NMP30493.1 bifunctional aspartate kinase/homoserine dehydrogenase II [Thalassotalea algicola]